MNTETIHDALTLLPEDLIAEADALRRSPKPKIVAWKRVLPSAACLAVILLSAAILPHFTGVNRLKENAAIAADFAIPEAAPADAPAAAAQEMERAAQGSMEDAPAEDAAPGLMNAVPAPLAVQYLPALLEDPSQQMTLCSTRADLDACLTLCADPVLDEACAEYDEDYFADHQLLLLLTAVYRPAGSYAGNVLLPVQEGTWYALETAEDEWTIQVQDMVPDVTHQDLTRQHILLELPGHAIDADDAITLVQEPTA